MFLFHSSDEHEAMERRVIISPIQWTANIWLALCQLKGYSVEKNDTQTKYLLQSKILFHEVSM